MVSKQSLGAKALARLEASGDGERARSLERWHWRAASAASASLLLRIAVTLRMLRVTVEEISPGNPQKKRVVRVMEISGGTELSEQNDFHAVALGEGPSVRRSGTVRGGGPRLRWGPWKLVARAIRALKLDLEDG